MEAIESKQSLSIESFSYSWLVNLKPSLESLESSFRASIDASDEASFIEMDPRLSPSKRFFRVPQDLSFDFPVSGSPLQEVHADELIYNGYLMPLVVKKPLKMAPHDASDSILAAPSSSLERKDAQSSTRVRCASLRRCRRLSKQILQKYFDFLKPFCQKITGSSRGRRSINRAKVHGDEGKNWEYYSPATSPRTSVAYSVDNWRRSCDSESSIYEAVLHCKRTIGK